MLIWSGTLGSASAQEWIRTAQTGSPPSAVAPVPAVSEGAPVGPGPSVPPNGPASGPSYSNSGPAPMGPSYMAPPNYYDSEPDRLFGLIAPSTAGFEDFISPMTNPVYFEDPRTVSEIRAIFANHHLPHSLGGENVQLYAAQIRAALTDDLSIIATKDGFFVSQNALVDDGWADLNIGLKANLFRSEESQQLLSAGVTYELPSGSHRSLQGRGDGQFHVFFTYGAEVFSNCHYITGTGFRLPSDGGANSQSWYWSHHLDYQLGDSGLYLFTEANWYHWIKSGNDFPLPVEGLDLFNLGSKGVAGNNIVTGAFGVKYKPSAGMELGVAYELPYTERRDIIQDRITIDLIFRY